MEVLLKTSSEYIDLSEHLRTMLMLCTKNSPSVRREPLENVRKLETVGSKEVKCIQCLTVVIFILHF